MTTPWDNEVKFAGQASATYDGVTNVEGLLLYDDPDDSYDGLQITIWANEQVTS